MTSSNPSSSDRSSYLLLLLSDSNLPTGGFVASSGLESFYAHGFLTSLAQIHAQAQIDSRSSLIPSADFNAQTIQVKQTGRTRPPSQTQLASATLSYISNLLCSYARSSLAFVADSHSLVNAYCKEDSGMEGALEDETRIERLLKDLKKLDGVYHSLTLNHVARRASTTQGIALLTLYSKAFSSPLDFGVGFGIKPQSQTDLREQETRRKRVGKVIDETKRRIRLGDMKGNLSICWGIFSAALGLNRAESTHLHLFLTARSLLSSSVRLNTLGPYLSQQLTLFNLPSIIDEALSGAGALESSRQSSSSTESEGWRCSTGMVDLSGHRNVLEGNKKLLDLSGSQNLAEGQETTKTPTKERVDDEDCNSQGFAWDWEDEGLWGNEISFEGEDKGRERYRDGKRNGSGNRSGEVEMIAPAQIWPLGELIQCRHDQLHSRLFNS